MSGIVDFHSHILPGIDDGSASVSESIAMLQMEMEQGIHQVVATPHFYPRHDSPERFLARRKEAESLLQEAMAECGNLPQIVCGAEVYYFPGISNCEALPELTIGNRPYILVEMPHGTWTKRMYTELEEIQARWGITPIVAHVDRYFSMLSTHGIPEHLEELPVLVQANASFFLHASSRGRAMRMLKRKQIHLLGSDCHNLTTRLPNLNQALEMIQKHLPEDALEWVEEYQDQVLL